MDTHKAHRFLGNYHSELEAPCSVGWKCGDGEPLIDGEVKRRIGEICKKFKTAQGADGGEKKRRPAKKAVKPRR